MAQIFACERLPLSEASRILSWSFPLDKSRTLSPRYDDSGPPWSSKRRAAQLCRKPRNVGARYPDQRIEVRPTKSRQRLFYSQFESLLRCPKSALDDGDRYMRNYGDPDISGPAVLAALRRHGRVAFDTLCSLLDVRGLTAQGELLQTLAKLYRQGLIVSDTSSFNGWESNATIDLAPTVPELVTVLGLSLKELVDRDPKNSVIVTPFFGRPPARHDGASADVFVLMPFRSDLKPIYEDHVKPVAATLGLSAKRADDFFSTHEVMRDVWEGIYEARVIVADCTDRNPNVFYEIGLAHAIGRQVILITQNADDVPFDLRSLRYIHYQYTPPGMKRFESILRETLITNVEPVSR